MREGLLAHLETWRPYTLSYVGLVGLAGAALAAPRPTIWQLLGAWAAPTLGWLAGLYGGDYFDRELDAVAKPHRPIPSGRLKPRTAVVAMAVCVAGGGLIALLANWRSLVLVGVALALGIAYSTVFKARGLPGNLMRGSLTGFAFVFGAMATVSRPGAWVLVGAAVFWLHDAGSNLVGTLRDIDGDRRGGYRTLAVRRGVGIAVACVAALDVSWVGLAVALPFLVPGPAHLAAYVPLLAVAVGLAIAAVAYLLHAPRPLPPRSGLRAHELLVLERVLLAGAILSLGANWHVGSSLTLAGVMFTWVSQRRMRERYEFGHRGPGSTAGLLEHRARTAEGHRGVNPDVPAAGPGVVGPSRAGAGDRR